MSSYIHTLAHIQGVAQGLLPEVLFAIGYPDDLSSASLETKSVFVGLDRRLQFTREDIESSTEAAEVVMDFGLYDDFKDPAESDNLLGTADVLINQFLEALNELETAEMISVSSIRKIPYQKKYGATISGYLLQMEWRINTCWPLEFPSLKEYVGVISKQVSPLNWEGVSGRL